MPSLSHILLVDDDDVNNFLNLRLLKRLGVSDQVNVVSSGQKALAFIAAHQQSKSPAQLLIFLDINMPMMNGFEFLDQLKLMDFGQVKPVIVMLTTSTNEKDMAQVSLYPEVASFLNKPLSEEKVDAVLKAHFPAAT